MSKRKISIFILASAIAVVSFFYFFWHQEEIRPNIVFILIDALRKDHLSCYGYERLTTPFIDSLARDGLLFENAITQAPWTGSSVASILTSKYPSQLGVGVLESSSKMKKLDPHSVAAMDEEALTLAEVLYKVGYKTISISTNPYVSDKFGLLQGFEKKTNCNANTRADKIVNHAIEHISIHLYSSEEHKSAPFFIYIHFMDLHEPNNPPPPYDTIYPTLDSSPHKEIHGRWDFAKAEKLDSDEFEIFKSHKIALYDGCLHFVDFQIRRLVDYLKSEDLSKNTIIVLASDHGEEFWEHAIFEKKFQEDSRGIYGVGHGHSLFKELLDVPLIFHGKHVPQKRIKELVRNIDITPTLLGLVGTKNFSTTMEGKDLIEKLKRKELRNVFAFSEDIAYGYEKKSIQNNQYKYIRGEKNEFLFNKIEDPQEMVDISDVQPKVTELFRKILDDTLRKFKNKKKKPVLMDKKTVEQLRALGYIK